MQRCNGLMLKLAGAGYSLLMSGMVLGHSVHPNSVLNYKKSLASYNRQEVKNKISEAETVSA